MITEDDPRFTAAIEHWRSRDILPTDKSSAALRSLGRYPAGRRGRMLADMGKQARRRAVFSARTTNAEYLREIADTVDALLSGEINMADGRLRLFRKLKEIGYDPQTGFPGEMGRVPKAERGSMADLSSARRLALVLETNTRMAANYGRMLDGNSEYALREYPAWELVRLYHRVIPRGDARSHSPGWGQRWMDAGDATEWEGASKAPMVARKDSPIWGALGDGAGGYADALGNPFPPFAFGSGMAWVAVPRSRCIELGLVEGDEAPAAMRGELSPGAREVNDVIDRLPPDLRAATDAYLRSISDRSQAEDWLAESEATFRRKEQAAAEARRALLPQKQAAHRHWLRGIAE